MGSGFWEDIDNADCPTSRITNGRIPCSYMVSSFLVLTNCSIIIVCLWAIYKQGRAWVAAQRRLQSAIIHQLGHLHTDNLPESVRGFQPFRTQPDVAAVLDGQLEKAFNDGSCGRSARTAYCGATTAARGSAS